MFLFYNFLMSDLISPVNFTIYQVGLEKIYVKNLPMPNHIEVLNKLTHVYLQKMAKKVNHASQSAWLIAGATMF